MTKRVGIDARLFSQTGVGIYIKNLLHYLEKVAPKNIEFFIYLRSIDLNKIEFKKTNFKKRPADYSWHSLNEQYGFLQTLNRDRLDLMHFTYFSYPYFYRKPFIMTIHDLTPLLYKTGRASTKNILLYNIKYQAYKLLTRRALRFAKKIITPTTAVKSEIVKFFGPHLAEKIIVTYEGVNYELAGAVGASQLKKNYKKPFFLYVGNFYPHKNVEKLINAFSSIDKKFNLVLVGPDDFFSKRITKLIEKLQLTDRVCLFKGANIGQLVFFYQNASALINPSISEGFGLPLIEAAYFKLPIIASDISVYREILGDNYVSFDPDNQLDIAEKINSLIENKRRFDYDAILNRFSFKKMAEETLDIYKLYV